MNDSSPVGSCVRTAFVGAIRLEGGASIQSSRLSDVCVEPAGGKLGSEGFVSAEDVKFKLSDVGISVARGCRG